MAHFAKIINGIVDHVIVAEPDFFDTFVDTVPGEWIQTSYNTHGGIHYNTETGQPDDGIPLRYNYAGPGFIYDKSRDAFYEPQPYPSWTLDEDKCIWQPPVPAPDSGPHTWNEETQTWDEVDDN
jgi:hypothetical protein